MQQQQPAMPVSIMSGQNAQQLLEQISDWGSMTTIVIHGGSVFEFTGPFPKATVAEGFQTKPHRGRESYAFVFEDANGDVIFKVFLGRDEKGELIASQREKFYQLMQQYQQALK